MIQFWSLHIVQKQLVNNLPPFKRSPSFLPRHQHSPVVANFYHCIWSTWNHHLFSIVYDPRGMMESPPFPIVLSTWNDGMTTFFPLYIRSTWSDYLFLLYMVHVGWPPFPIVYGPRGMTTFSHSIWSTLLTTLWFSCILQEPTVSLSVLILSPSLSSLPSSGRSSASYSSDEVKSLKDLQSLREMTLSIGCYK